MLLQNKLQKIATIKKPYVSKLNWEGYSAEITAKPIT